MAVRSTLLLKLRPQSVHFLLKAVRVGYGFVCPLAFLFGSLAFLFSVPLRFTGPSVFLIRPLELTLRFLSFRRKHLTGDGIDESQMTSFGCQQQV